MNIILLSFEGPLLHAIKSFEPLIQIILGPRQVGKTTGTLNVLQNFSETDYHDVSADE